jgi:hypothetical protein
MALTYHETRGSPRRRGLDLPLSPKQREAATLLRQHLKGGRINKSELVELLWGDAPPPACNDCDCDCEDCRTGKCPHTQGRNTRMHAHARGQDDDRRQIMADLLSDDRSPFTPDDEQSLMMMSDTTLRTLRDRYLRANSGASNMHAHDLIRLPDGSYLRAGDLEAYQEEQRALHANARALSGDADGDDEAGIAAMTHYLHLQGEGRVPAARDLRKGKGKKAGHDAKAWTKDSPYTPDDEEALREAVEDEGDEAVRAMASPSIRRSLENQARLANGRRLNALQGLDSLLPNPSGQAVFAAPDGEDTAHVEIDEADEAVRAMAAGADLWTRNGRS